MAYDRFGKYYDETASMNHYAARPPVTVDDAIARARADSEKGGLKMIVQHDDAGRPVRTFKLEGGATKRSTWMGAFMGEAQEQVMLNRKNIPTDEFEAVKAKWLADREARNQATRDIAAGKDVRCDLSYDYTSFYAN